MLDFHLRNLLGSNSDVLLSYTDSFLMRMHIYPDIFASLLNFVSAGLSS